MKKEQKIKSIDIAKDIFANNSVVVVLNYKGLDAKNIYDLRRKLKVKDANIKILKNTLVKRAIGENYKDMLPSFKEQVAISYSSDPVSLSNVLVNFVKENEVVTILSGYSDGKLLTLETIKNLASLGSIDEVRAKFVGVLKAPGSAIARILKLQEEKMSA
ncbi:MAG: 50S ribosomal protein L10 [Rickettsiales bacterium]|jgi:large subunit ribosomal protein L10|nr:50S ribosomal protein L10 [Rickettsiales bacterium]